MSSIKTYYYPNDLFFDQVGLLWTWPMVSYWFVWPVSILDSYSTIPKTVFCIDFLMDALATPQKNLGPVVALFEPDSLLAQAQAS